MKRILLAVVCCVLFLFGGSLSAKAVENTGSTLEKAAQLSDQALELAKEERYKEASEVLSYLLTQFGKSEEQAKLARAQQRLVDSTMETTLATLGKIEGTQEEKVERLTGVRLLLDAIVSDQQPLWKQMEYKVVNPLKRMQLTAKQGHSTEVQEATNEFLSNYYIVRPALSVDIAEETFAAVDDQVAFIEKMRSHSFQTKADQERLATATATLESVFTDEKEASEPSLFWLITSIGGIISATLFYVGWRKYRGEKTKLKETDKR
ncbi:sporulation protein YpjB [Fictibacillus macauensis ZFHKF-1]|uniref:Sporulation protein YpjB n=1 Tax=Fictibacillus macauensis ZFHKF-1 TaxID=1196324 RepID=I8AL61_9BACL|nr:sporulation protein YpjB [Fictibacillus macauensis]EIT86607.1 sporulation protein YpjB [Fictibacillus macauensis ZFHKF-1]